MDKKTPLVFKCSTLKYLIIVRLSCLQSVTFNLTNNWVRCQKCQLVSTSVNFLTILTFSSILAIFIVPSPYVKQTKYGSRDTCELIWAQT